MNQRTAWIVYSVLRLLFFAIPFAVLYLIGWQWWLAAITATLIALALSVIFLYRPRSVASESVYDWRTRSRTHDDVAEDSVLDQSDEHRDEPSTGHSAERGTAPSTEQNTEPSVAHIADETTERPSI